MREKRELAIVRIALRHETMTCIIDYEGAEELSGMVSEIVWEMVERSMALDGRRRKGLRERGKEVAV
ncbi:MAG: hypothetical protein LBR08_11185 [Bacteroidales bacterium]|nr:hypothetical protein [Bacteroidales bacterium]